MPYPPCPSNCDCQDCTFASEVDRNIPAGRPLPEGLSNAGPWLSVDRSKGTGLGLSSQHQLDLERLTRAAEAATREDMRKWDAMVAESAARSTIEAAAVTGDRVASSNISSKPPRDTVLSDRHRGMEYESLKRELFTTDPEVIAHVQLNMDVKTAFASAFEVGMSIAWKRATTGQQPEAAWGKRAATRASEILAIRWR